MIDELDSLTPLGAEMNRRAAASGLLLIWRLQSRSARRVLVRQGRTEEVSIASSSGQGIQVVTDDGRTALACRDDFREEESLALLERVVATVERASSLGLHPVEIPALRPVTGRAVPDGIDAFERLDLDEVGRRLVELEREIGAMVPDLTTRISLQTDLDAWRVFRSDGTDVLYAMPRCALRVVATASDKLAKHSVVAGLPFRGPDMLWQERSVERFLRRAVRAARLARELPDAPQFPPGSYPLVIGYELAKGLAHEAFGHASEADGYRSSVLAKNGRYRSGATVGASHVSIVDEPIEGDYAWQPYSANGVRRERTVIVDHGRLNDGLSDLWSARPGGVRLTGAARAESFRHAPLPRMSNIRIEVDDPLPAAGEYEDYGPEEVRDLLADAGVLRRHPRLAFLSGYSGGQVNCATGDFVFNCKAIYEISREAVRLHKPAIFSGSMFGALGAVREALGPLRLDAAGTCGKWGQSVASCGGSHYFLVLDPSPDFRLGGR